MRCVWLAVVVGIGCGAPPPEPLACTKPGGTGGGPTTDIIMMVDQASTLTLAVNPTLFSSGGVVSATSVRVSVVGPDNLPVAFSQANLGESSIDVTLTPHVAGPYHL